MLAARHEKVDPLTRGKTKAPAGAQSGDSALSILEAAERLCGERGLESVSVRDIAREAGVSISVIYHHFGSKANLLRTILQTRLRELAAVRAEIFGDLESQEKPDLKRLLYAIFAPVAQLKAPGNERHATMQFLARSLVSTVPELREEVEEVVEGLRQVVRLFERALPHLSHADICWRLHFTFGIEQMTHWDDARLAIMSEGACDSRSTEETIERAVAFAEAAFLAPPMDDRTSGR